MTSLFISISGCSGGSNGPQGIYPLLQKLSPIQNCTFVAIDTKPQDINENVTRTCDIAMQYFDTTENVYLMGYSMGGAVAVQAADKLSRLSKKPKGIILLSTQSDALYPLRELGIPVLFFHGRDDETFPLWQIESTFEGCLEPKKMIEIEGVDHDLAPKDMKKNQGYSEILAKAILNEIDASFQKSPIIGKDRVSISFPKEKNSSFFSYFSSFFCA